MKLDGGVIVKIRVCLLEFAFLYSRQYCVNFSVFKEPVTKSDFKVEVKRKQPRAFSAKDHPVSKAKNTMVDNARRKSLDNSFRRDEYKLDHIERELKRTTSELQKKLNINPKGCLNFR